MLEAFFWLMLAGLFYSYFLYPLILLLIPAKSLPTVAAQEAPLYPTVSFIVTAYNEEHRILTKLVNTEKLDYPREKLQVIVASDGSTDTTDQIVENFKPLNVRLVRPTQRLGKENAQAHAIKEATGQIIIFSDVATEIPSDAIKAVTQYFQNPDIGALSSEDRFTTSTGEVAGEGAYVKYEMWLRKQESMRAGLIGLSGSFFAARAEICQDWDIKSPSDFNTALNCFKLGFKSVSATDVIGYYSDLKDPKKEYDRKVRTVIRGMTSLARHKDCLNPLKFGLFAFQVWSHKLMRWLVPYFMIGALIANCFLLNEHSIYQLVFATQVIAYLVSILSFKIATLEKIAPIRLIGFFLRVNIAILDASIRFLGGQRMTVWEPSQR